MADLPKAYEPQLVEDQITARWLASGYFNPDNHPRTPVDAPVFSMVLPPPNVTGTLHLGHATMLAIEDAMTRYARLAGKRTLWIPGTDHAAIATQSKVEGLIQKAEGKNRHDLGREPFLDRVRQFAQESHDTIVNQCKKMGASLDWSREAYTLDNARNLAVNEAFKRMYNDGLIYRGYRVVNWDPIGQTTIADDEVVYKEGVATLYTFKYAPDFPIAISTTRPETKVGDTAVAVHPTDERYKHLIGQTIEVADFCGSPLSITIVADEAVDPAFGTGALGVTPAHSPIDFDMAQRHSLTLRQVIGEDGCMTTEAGSQVAGLTTLEARAKVVAWLRAQNLLVKEEESAQNLSTAERTGGVIEPLPKLQWFIAVNKEFTHLSGRTVTLKQLMQEAVRSGDINILPDRFNKTYFHWIDNLRDWNISRQIWFGHRVPVWYRREEVSVGAPGEGDGWVQDEDTLDTWFSSGLWTFSTLGWPGQTEDLRRFHPTSVLETGYDILFFWVARMVLMSTYLVGEVPFKTVYLHGLVRDAEGRKMSKSLGNIINPLDMIEKYGADATRLSLLLGNTPGNDLRLSEEKIAGYRNFVNKLWNISRFILTRVDNIHRVVDEPAAKTTADRWILGRLAAVTQKVTALHEAYDLSLAGEILREFTWTEFADWYLEIAKIEGGKDDVLLYVLERLVTLWHPFIPFVTEEIWSAFGEPEPLLVGTWPTANNAALATNDVVAITQVQEVITAIRNLRAQYKVAPGQEVNIHLSSALLAADAAPIIEKLARVKIAEGNAESAAKAVVGSLTIAMPLIGVVDLDAERARLYAELTNVQNYAQGIEAKLANADFRGRAPQAVVEAENKKLEEATEKVRTLAKEIAEIEAL
jgi:valyl-tRNA synthetase